MCCFKQLSCDTYCTIEITYTSVTCVVVEKAPTSIDVRSFSDRSLQPEGCDHTHKGNINNVYCNQACHALT